jgi:hypothetical protein
LVQQRPSRTLILKQVLKRVYLRVSGRISRVAMAKVEGSNPFIRFERKPCKSRGFLLYGAGAAGRLPQRSRSGLSLLLLGV